MKYLESSSSERWGVRRIVLGLAGVENLKLLFKGERVSIS